MAVFSEPSKWAQTLGKDADVTTIPNTAGDTDPSIDKIFPAVFSIPLAQGGRAVPRSVLNGLFKLLGDWIYYIQNGGIASYSNTFDYAVGSFVKYNDEFYRCIQANGASTEVKAPTETTYWSKITTLADVANAFADQDLSNVTDTAKIAIAHNSMPSDNFDTLTMGASGTTYTATADGFFWAAVQLTATGYISCTLKDSSNNTIYAINNVGTTSGQAPNVLIPAKKGNILTITYNSSSSPYGLKFIYAVGSESEQ